MKIVLAALNAKYVHSNLAVYDLAAYAEGQLNRDSGNPVETKDTEPVEIVVREYTINHNLDLILQSLYREKAAVVAFSCYIWNVHEILTIAKELSKVAPQTRIWLGGPEVSYDSEKVLRENPFVEGIMQGEGEVTFYELVKIWRKNCDENRDWGNVINESKMKQYLNKNPWDIYKDILGIIYRDSKDIIHQNPARPLMSLDELPFIYKDLSKFENKILYYESSRGCPFSCSYCLSSIDKSVRFRSLNLVEEELQFFLDHKVPQVKFVDRTFNCKKEHALAIWRYITEHDNGITNFHFEVSADLIGEEELEVMCQMRPGLIQLEIGLQSTNSETIREIRRSMNVEKLKANMLAIRGFGNIHQHLDLIAGLPYEDYETFQNSFNEAYDMKPNQLQLGFLKVLKGSYMEEQVMEYGLQYQVFQPYEVLCTRWLSYDEILALKKVEEMVEVYYNSDQFEYVLSYVIPFFESPYAFYEALGNYFEQHDLFGIGYKREARYEVLRQFVLECFGKCDRNEKVKNSCRLEQPLSEAGKNLFSQRIFDSLLTYDYYLRENAKSRPVWAKEEPIEKVMYQEFFKRGGTEEIALGGEGYDSKVAARRMHIEPIVDEAVRWIVEEMSENQEQRVSVLNGICEQEQLSSGRSDTFEQEQTPSGYSDTCERAQYYCLFDYEKRNPLSKDATVVILSHL